MSNLGSVFFFFFVPIERSKVWYFLELSIISYLAHSHSQWNTFKATAKRRVTGDLSHEFKKCGCGFYKSTLNISENVFLGT